MNNNSNETHQKKIKRKDKSKTELISICKLNYPHNLHMFWRKSIFLVVTQFHKMLSKIKVFLHIIYATLKVEPLIYWRSNGNKGWKRNGKKVAKNVIQSFRQNYLCICYSTVYRVHHTICTESVHFQAETKMKCLCFYAQLEKTHIGMNACVCVHVRLCVCVLGSPG